MQGSRSSAAVLPDIMIFDNDSISTEPGMSSPSPWNTLPIPVQNQLPSSETHSQYLQQHARRNIRSSEWYLGESSSIVHPLSTHTNGSFLMPNSSDPSAVANPRDLNNVSEFEDQEDDDDDDDDDEEDDDDDDDDCRVIGSSSNGITINGIADMPGSSSNGNRASCKRKALEFQAGPSSGSSSFFQNTERRQWNGLPEQVNNSNSITNNAPEQANNGLRLGVGHAFIPGHFYPTVSANEDISRRNFRLRIHGLRQQDSILPENPFLSDPTEVRNVDLSSSPRHSLRSALRNRSPELNPSTLVENGSLHGQSTLLEVQNPTVRRIHHSRWSGSPSARISRSSNPTPIFEENTHRTIPGQALENPMFVGVTENGSSSPNPMNWNFSGVGGNNNTNSNSNSNNNLNNDIADTTIAGNATSASPRAAFVRGEGSSAAAGGSRRSLPHYQRRLSEIVRRSLMLSERNASNNVTQSQEMESSDGPNDNNNVGHQVPSSRSGLLEDFGASGVPYSWRSLVAAATEGGSSSPMSEQIRHVLDLMRRGEGLRIEDVMILDHSVFFGMEDVHDQHQDMRLDVDNMSYEELLALEERIGVVCTGLSEDTVMMLMKQWKFSGSEGDKVETEPCSICREDYINGEDLGALECGHDFHRDCIKQWLVQKNVCPICKATGLNT